MSTLETSAVDKMSGSVSHEESTDSSTGSEPALAHPACAHGIQYVPERIRRSRRKQSKDNLASMVKGAGKEKKSPEVASLLAENGTSGSSPETDWLYFDYPFENLVLSGGGTKGYSYIGAAQALEDCGILSKITRVGGTSIGAISGSLFAVGCNLQEIANFMAGGNDYIDWVFKDQDFQKFFTLPNLWRRYGVHSGRRFYKLLGEVFEKKTGSADITFKELYETRGKELCVSVTNLSRMCSEYLNRKTTPDLPIRVAVRMSSSVPVMMAPVKYNISGQGSFFYSDGSLLDHYPIHCFDGDELIPFNSCKQTICNNETYNEKTLGFFLLSEDTADYRMWRSVFHREIPFSPTYIPQSKLAKTRLDEEYKRRKKKTKNYSRKQMDAELKDHTTGEWLHYDILDREAVDVTSASHVILRVLQAMFTMQRHNYTKEGDADRTIPINCGYVQTIDTVVEPADKEFLIKQGYAHTKAFLQDYVAKRKKERERSSLLVPRNPRLVNIDDLKFADEPADSESESES